MMITVTEPKDTRVLAQTPVLTKILQAAQGRSLHPESRGRIATLHSIEARDYGTFSGGGGGGGMKNGGMGPPNRMVSNIFNTKSCWVALNSFPQIQREFLPATFGKYAPVVPCPGVRGRTTFATWLPICFLAIKYAGALSFLK
jgi:hypothetical protein